MTLEDDVAAVLERLRQSRKESLKQLVNEALRCGLRNMTSQSEPRRPFRTHSVGLGQVKAPGIDNISEALVMSEHESFK